MKLLAFMRKRQTTRNKSLFMMNKYEGSFQQAIALAKLDFDHKVECQFSCHLFSAVFPVERKEINVASVLSA